MGQNQRFTNVYVKNFGEDFTDELLMETFAAFGKIVSAKVMLDHNTGKGRGFGFVSFETPEAAAMVCVYTCRQNGRWLVVIHSLLPVPPPLPLPPSPSSPPSSPPFPLSPSSPKAVEEMSGKLLNGRPVYCGRAQKKKERMVELQRRYEAERMERYSRWECVGMVSHSHVIWFSHDPQFPLSMVNHYGYGGDISSQSKKSNTCSGWCALGVTFCQSFC